MELFSNSTYSMEADGNTNSCYTSFDCLCWQKGYTRQIYKGVLKGSGCNAETRVLAKAFRKSPGAHDRCSVELAKHKKADQLFQIFNENFPEAAEMRVTWATMAQMESVAFFHTGRKLKAEEYVIVEEMMDNRHQFRYFVDQYSEHVTRSCRDFHTLMHFCYDYTGGELVLADLKGVRSKKGYKFTTPTIHSRDGDYGHKDEGQRGIEKCFENHVCSAVCAGWLRPDSETEVKQRPRAPSAPYDPDMVDNDHGLPPPYTPSPEGSPMEKFYFPHPDWYPEVAYPQYPLYGQYGMNFQQPPACCQHRFNCQQYPAICGPQCCNMPHPATFGDHACHMKHPAMFGNSDEKRIPLTVSDQDSVFRLGNYFRLLGVKDSAIPNGDDEDFKAS